MHKSMTHHLWKRRIALAIASGLVVTALGGCGKKNVVDEAAAMISLQDGGTLSLGEANMLLRYAQADFDGYYGMLYEYFYGITDVWNTDLEGYGVNYGETFKAQQVDVMERLLRARKGMNDV